MRKTFNIVSLAVLVILAGSAVGQIKHKSNLPHRDALDTEVRFWKKVFAKYSLDQHVIHDSENLGIIYKVVSFDSAVSDRKRSKQLKAIKEDVKDLLLKFHSGKYKVSELTVWEKQVYQQFSDIKDKNKFRTASKRVRAQQGIMENFLAGVRRSFAYLPYIKKVFADKGIPRELIYLPHVESSFNPNARSHVGATGMWQFMRGTARMYMKVNRIKDERYDPLVSTKAAARLLKYNYSKLNDWALAITAYNHGLGSMKKAKRRHKDYLTIREKYLRRSFGFASKNFYPEVLAVVEIQDSLSHYFPGIQGDPVLLYQEITLPKPITLNRFAKQFKIETTELKSLNPGFRSQVWRGTRRVPANYIIRLPLQADAQQILADLGASKDDFNTIKLAKKDPYRDKVILSNFKDTQIRRGEIKRSLNAQITGVAEPESRFDAAVLTSSFFVMESAEERQQKNPAIQINTADRRQLRKPEAPENPAASLALANLYELDGTRPAVKISQKPVLAIHPAATANDVTLSAVPKPGVLETDIQVAALEAFRFVFSHETTNPGNSSASASFQNLLVLQKPGVENAGQLNYFWELEPAVKQDIAAASKTVPARRPGVALNKKGVDLKSPYYAGFSDWTISYNACLLYTSPSPRD